MTNSLWPDFTKLQKAPGMLEMLYDAAGGLSDVTNEQVDFHVDSVGVGDVIDVREIRYNCYVRAIKKGYLHLLFQVTTPFGKAFPALLATPEGDQFSDINNEEELVAAIKTVLQRDRTTEIVLYLMSLGSSS